MGNSSHHRAVLAVLATMLALTLLRAHCDNHAALTNDAAGATRETAPPSSASALRINDCSADELRRAARIGARLAQRIIDERERRRGFCSLSELDAIEGVGPAILRRLEERVVFDSQIHGPTRPCDHGHAVREPAVEEHRVIRPLHGEAEVTRREPVDADARAAADRPAGR